jgi:hypothetical protein
MISLRCGRAVHLVFLEFWSFTLVSAKSILGFMMTPVVKTKAIYISLLAVALALWATWSCAYKRGYARGSQDELACWKIDSMGDPTVPTPTMSGKRDLWRLPGGAPWPKPKSVTRSHSVNNFTAITINHLD